MKFGVREICDVVLRKKAAGWFGKLYLEKGMPVLYFDTLKTSSLEGAATTVYAQGGKGNPRLVAWEGDRTVTFTMEDALISSQSFSILSGAGFMDASASKPIYVHTTEQVACAKVSDAADAVAKFSLSKKPDKTNSDAEMYVMLLDDNGNINAEYIPFKLSAENIKEAYTPAELSAAISNSVTTYNSAHQNKVNGFINVSAPAEISASDVVFFDYYVKAESGVRQIDIEASKFGGSYYLEASTLFRDRDTGDDYPAEFIIPNCKVQSNFTFTMAPTGDPSTFTFTMDAFPDYTKFDRTKKVIAALQIVEDRDGFGKLDSAASNIIPSDDPNGSGSGSGDVIGG